MSDVHNEIDVVLLLLLFAWFYFMDSVLWIIIFYCVASVIKKENTKFYYLVVVIMIEKKFFFFEKNSYKSFLISLTKCKTSYKQCFKQWSWICWTGGGSVCSFSFGLCLLSFWRTLCVQ